ncbi:MarR family winged helix-turn-helix transcriptional regulator [Agarivorans sp. QJM3NY_29]|uniref:MarR family winged helix-turn-helix transcriptional regulator n=1 Tax=unclassified Agarivorans TaxID=2636026 RepID=UPI003D7E4A3B
MAESQILFESSVKLLYAQGMNKESMLFLNGKFQSLMKLAQQMEKAPRKFGTDEILSNSEIHLIEIIGDHRDLSVTDIANALGITKGAVSQALKKLEKKGFTEKSPAPDNLSRAIVRLTSKGEIAFVAHKEWHEKMDGGFANYIQELGQEDIKVISEFLERTEDFLIRRVNSPE